MEINVARIARSEGIAENFEITDETSQYDLDFCGEKLKTIPPIKVKGSAINYEGKINVDMSISTEVRRICSRCLEPFVERVEIHPQYTFVREIKDTNEDYYLYKGDTIDITDLVLGEIAAELTMKPLCKEDCSGICPICGKNKNLQACNCKDQQIDSRLQILSKLLDQEQGGV